MMVNPWLTLEVTNSPFWVGAAAGVGGVGLLLFGAIGGVLVDRVDRRRVLALVSVVQASSAATIAVLVFSDGITLWQIMAVNFVGAFSIAVREPAMAATTLDIAGRGNLLRALAWNLVARGGMGTITPLFAGAVVTGFGIGWVYVLAVCSDLVAITVFLSLRPVTTRPARRRLSPITDFKEAVAYAMSSPAIKVLIVTSLIVKVFAWAHQPMISVMARDVLGTDASGFGYLLSAAHLGGILGSLVLASWGRVRADGRLVMIGAGGYGLFLIGFAASPMLGLSMAVLGLAYAMESIYEAAFGTVVQNTVPDEMRGRILSFQAMTWGFYGLSGFHMGAIARSAGAPIAIGVGGGVTAAYTLALFRRAGQIGRDVLSDSV